MRWWVKKSPREGEIRIKTGFLFLPKKIKNQWRWLEFAEWEQVYDIIWHDKRWLS